LTKDLYTTKDVEVVRNQMLEAQKGIDPITKEPIKVNQAVLDHCHDSQKVRAVLSRPCNIALGKIENLWSRYLSWWYGGTLPQFLRGCADYIEQHKVQEPIYTHPAWLKKIKIEFKKLKAIEQSNLLAKMGSSGNQTNLDHRLKSFTKLLLQKKMTFKELSENINETCNKRKDS
jgi:hypothetical protein